MKTWKLYNYYGANCMFIKMYNYVIFVQGYIFLVIQWLIKNRIKTLNNNYFTLFNIQYWVKERQKTSVNQLWNNGIINNNLK